MKNKLFPILMLNCCFCLPALSQVTNIGNSDCGEWVATSKTNPAMRAWLLGFMSGVNAGLSNPKNDRLSKINSAAQIFLWMDNYCAKNPLKSVHEGGNELFRELGKN